MTKSISKASLVESAPAKRAPAESRIHRIELSALLALFWLALRQHVRARRLLILAALLALPSLIAILIRSTDPTVKLQELEFELVFLLMPHALVPLTALLYASGMIQDEIEEQTLTYLLIRPLPKWSIYLTKLLATLVVTTLLTCVFTLATYLAIHVGIGDFLGADPLRALKTAGLFALALAAYCSILGLISLLTRRSLVAGVAYIFVFEGLLANVDFVVRKLTVMYYFRVLVERWIGLSWKAISNRDVDQWSIDLSKAPSSANCLVTLLTVSLVCTAIGALTFMGREFRLKTPEGS